PEIVAATRVNYRSAQRIHLERDSRITMPVYYGTSGNPLVAVQVKSVSDHPAKSRVSGGMLFDTGLSTIISTVPYRNMVKCRVNPPAAGSLLELVDDGEQLLLKVPTNTSHLAVSVAVALDFTTTSEVTLSAAFSVTQNTGAVWTIGQAFPST